MVARELKELGLEEQEGQQQVVKMVLAENLHWQLV
jgi:hypothetical protein